MKYDKENIIDELGLVPFGSQGWLSNKEMACPFCGKPGKWGVIFNDTGGATFHCWKCPRKTSLYEFLKKIGRTDLARVTYTAKPDEVCPRIGEEQTEESQWMTSMELQPLELQPVALPLRLKPLVGDEYLESRGFNDYHYRLFEPSYTNTSLEPKLRNYIVFKMKMNGVCVAWWARSRYSKEWHKENLELYKQHKAELVLRYRNSESNFQDLLGGYDQLVEGVTQTVILVEGIFDMINITNILGLADVNDVKCCFTFGNSIGKGQIESLLRKKVRNIVLLYDDGTIDESREAALRMRELFDTVMVAAIRRRGVDPGNIDIDYLMEVLESACDPLTFSYNRLEMKI